MIYSATTHSRICRRQGRPAQSPRARLHNRLQLHRFTVPLSSSTQLLLLASLSASDPPTHAPPSALNRRSLPCASSQTTNPSAHTSPTAEAPSARASRSSPGHTTTATTTRSRFRVGPVPRSGLPTTCLDYSRRQYQCRSRYLPWQSRHMTDLTGA
jgi:hypothetical protein